MKTTRLLLVYNADSGMFNSVIGWTHKVFSPSTYQCSLCRHTFGLSGMLLPWRTFIELLPLPAEFLHRDIFVARFPALAAHILPSIFIESKGTCETLLGAAEINRSSGLVSLMALMNDRLGEWSKDHTGGRRSDSPGSFSRANRSP